MHCPVETHGYLRLIELSMSLNISSELGVLAGAVIPEDSLMSLDLAGRKLAKINGAELEYWDSGSGPPVLFVHGGMGDECAAILREPALTTRFQLIHFQRRGYGASTSPEQPASMARHAADSRAILDLAGVRLAHVVGQSYGGAVSLQLAVDAADTVHSLTLLEPALPSVLLGSPEFSASMKDAVELYESGRGHEAIEQFARVVVGAAGWQRFAAAGWVERWVGDATTLFEGDVPPWPQWEFGESDAARISQPVLNLRGADTPAAFVEVFETLKRWMPHAESRVVPHASHPRLQMNPSGTAELMADFFDRHPIGH